MRRTLLVGSEDRGLSVVFEAEPFLFVEAFSGLDEPMERVGVLTGRPSRRGRHVVIQGASEVRRVGDSPVVGVLAGTARVGGCTPWRRGRVVGWFHVRPGLGAHVARSDISARARFPGVPTFVLYIVDPSANARTLVRWEGGTVVRCGGFLVKGSESELRVAGQLLGPQPSLGDLSFDLSDERASGVASGIDGTSMRVGVSSASRDERLARAGRRARMRWGWAGAAAVAIAVLLTSAWAVRLGRLRNGPPDPPAAVTASQQGGSTVVGAVAGPQEDLSIQQDRSPTARPVTSYHIQPGDTLWGISSRYYGVGSKYGVLARSNGIPDPDRIYAGDMLEIPLDMPLSDR